MATHCPARKIRSLAKFIMMARKPAFSMPMRFDAGTRQSSKASSAVSLARQPVFLSLPITSKPGVSFSTTRSEMPPWPSGPVRTAVVMKSARVPDVMKVFAPLTT